MEIRTIFGPPGCGKTHDLMKLAAMEAGKNNVLMLSYTKAAATEMVSRITDTVGKIKGSTLHSMAFGKLNMSRESVVDQTKIDAFSKVTGIPFKANGEEDEQDGDSYRSVLSYSKSKIIHISEAYDMMGRPGTLKGFQSFVKQYEQWKTTYGYMDFDDMLVAASKQEYDPPAVIMLDEAQDCSPLQWLVFERFVEKAKRVYIAGDDDQAIFEWNGADPHGMINFSKKRGAKYRVLEDSHRMPSKVHEFVHDAVLNEIGNRVDKKFNPREFEGSIQHWSGSVDHDFRKLVDSSGSNLILVRDSFRMKEVASALNSDLVPYTIAGDRRSPFEDGLSHAIRGLIKGESEITPLEESMVRKYARQPNDSISAMIRAGWQRSIKVPDYMIQFYESVDLLAPIVTKISTIHQSKGTEADNVMVDLTMTQRVEEGAHHNRDAELRVWYVAFTRAKKSLHIFGENTLI